MRLGLGVLPRKIFDFMVHLYAIWEHNNYCKGTCGIGNPPIPPSSVSYYQSALSTNVNGA